MYTFTHPTIRVTHPTIRATHPTIRGRLVTKIRKEQANNELLLEKISAGISVGPSKKIYQTLNLRLKAIVRDLDLNNDNDCELNTCHCTYNL